MLATNVSMTEMEKKIYSNAFSEIRLKKKYLSPFREEKRPSFEFYRNNKSGRLWWQDWSTGEKGNCYDFLDKWTGEISPRQIRLIEKDQKPPPKIISGKVWTINFWNKYSISKKTLELFNVEQVESVNGRKHILSFIYFIKNKKKYRVYTPNGELRFWGTISKEDIFGYEQLPEKAKLLIITKSLKDVMTLYEMGIPAISFSSETITPSGKVIDELKERFENIILLYDNDETGVKQSTRISSIFGLNKIFMKSTKDISDCVEKEGKTAAQNELWEEILKDAKDKEIKKSYLLQRS